MFSPFKTLDGFQLNGDAFIKTFEIYSPSDQFLLAFWNLQMNHLENISGTGLRSYSERILKLNARLFVFPELCVANNAPFSRLFRFFYVSPSTL